jgi:PPM family protein phosphatase
MAPFYFATSARSAVGLVRNGNEDSALASKHLVAVADGMGGHAAGEVASSIAVKTLAQSAKVFTHPEIDEESGDDLYLQSIQDVDAAIKSEVEENPALSGMGTTLTSLFLRGNAVALLHIGDSRAYRLRGSSFDQLSVDHTVIQSDIASHPQRSVLTQVLMGEGNIEVPLPLFDVKPGDRFLICSDGLSSVLTEKEIKTLLKGRDREDAVAALVEATYVNGAPDNVTLIVADIVEEDQADKYELIGAAE